MLVLSNFLAGAFDSVRRGALDIARRALPQRCELCAAASGSALVCAACANELPRLGPACPVCALPTRDGQLCASDAQDQQRGQETGQPADDEGQEIIPGRARFADQAISPAQATRIRGYDR